MALPAFSFSLPGSADPPNDVFGLWAPAAGLSPPPGGEIGAVWRADLPDDLDSAYALLDQRERQLGLIQRALPAADRRLSSDLRAIDQAGAGGASFSLGGETLASPRGVLAAALSHQELGVSYGLFDQGKIAPFQLEETTRAVSRFGEQVRRAVDQLALVETSSAGRKVGITRAAWSGDVETWWAAGAGSDRRRQHEQVLAQALATRQGWLRLLLVAASGITRVAAALATGPFSLISVWTAWNYVQEAVKEYQKLAGEVQPARQE